MSSEISPRIKVWDAVVRTFHWLLVPLFLLTWWTSQSGMQRTHEWLGYFIAILLVVRLIWGVIGSVHARFGSFVCSPRVTLAYLKAMVAAHPRRYLGHNPAGGWMVVAILSALLISILSGLVVQAVIEFDAPFVAAFQWMGDQQAYLFLDLHTFMLNVFWVLIPFHIAGVVLASLQHRENLVRAMVTGFKINRL